MPLPAWRRLRADTRTDGPEVGPDVPRSAWQHPSFFERVAELGLAVASVEYRLSGEASFPAQPEDLESAASYLAEHRADFGISTDTHVCWGLSAGGHLAALHALTTALPVAAAVCWYPATDLVAQPVDIDDAGGQADRSRGSREARLLGATTEERPEAARAASPSAPCGRALHRSCPCTVTRTPPSAPAEPPAGRGAARRGRPRRGRRDPRRDPHDPAGPRGL